MRFWSASRSVSLRYQPRGKYGYLRNYSGTMGAAAEGCIFNVPSMGVSLLDHAADADFSECCRLGRMLARRY